MKTGGFYMNESERIIRQSQTYQKLVEQFDQVNQQLFKQLNKNDQQTRQITELYNQVRGLYKRNADLTDKLLAINNENSKLNDQIDELTERPNAVVVKYPDKNYQDLANELTMSRQELADLQYQYDLLNKRYQKLVRKR